MSATTQDKAILDRYRDLSVGEILRRARMRTGQNLPEIAYFLNIRESLLEALEQDDHARLPGRVYVVGFVRTYAEYLGLDGDKIAYLLKSQSLGHEHRVLRDMPKPINDRRLPGPGVMIASGVGLVTLIIVLSFAFGGSKEKPEIPEAPEPPKVESVVKQQ